jgi:hypothetical protein
MTIFRPKNPASTFELAMRNRDHLSTTSPSTVILETTELTTAEVERHKMQIYKAALRNHALYDPTRYDVTKKPPVAEPASHKNALKLHEASWNVLRDVIGPTPGGQLELVEQLNLGNPPIPVGVVVRVSWTVPTSFEDAYPGGSGPRNVYDVINLIEQKLREDVRTVPYIVELMDFASIPGRMAAYIRVRRSDTGGYADVARF